jgi:hypothetical protein
MHCFPLKPYYKPIIILTLQSVGQFKIQSLFSLFASPLESFPISRCCQVVAPYLKIATKACILSNPCKPLDRPFEPTLETKIIPHQKR